MHRKRRSIEAVEYALRIVQTGLSTARVSRMTGIPLGTIEAWVRRYADGVTPLRRRRKPFSMERCRS